LIQKRKKRKKEEGRTRSRRGKREGRDHENSGTTDELASQGTEPPLHLLQTTFSQTCVEERTKSREDEGKTGTVKEKTPRVTTSMASPQMVEQPRLRVYRRKGRTGKRGEEKETGARTKKRLGKQKGNEGNAKMSKTGTARLPTIICFAIGSGGGKKGEKREQRLENRQ